MLGLSNNYQHIILTYVWRFAQVSKSMSDAHWFTICIFQSRSNTEGTFVQQLLILSLHLKCFINFKLLCCRRIIKFENVYYTRWLKKGEILIIKLYAQSLSRTSNSWMAPHIWFSSWLTINLFILYNSHYESILTFLYLFSHFTLNQLARKFSGLY